MDDPELKLLAEAASGVPAPVLPTPAPAVPGVPVVAQPVAPAPAPSAWAPLWSFIRAQWVKVTTPTSRTRAEYRDWKLAVLVDHELDDGPVGPAHTNELGEATAMVVDHLIRGGKGGQLSPLGHLGSASVGYGWELWNTVRRPETPAEPAKPTAHVGVPQIHAPAPVARTNDQDVVADQADDAVRGPSKRRRKKA